MFQLLVPHRVSIPEKLQTLSVQASGMSFEPTQMQPQRTRFIHATHFSHCYSLVYSLREEALCFENLLICVLLGWRLVYETET